MLRQLATRNLIPSVFVDEAHTIHREGLNGSKFRTEFDSGFSNLLEITEIQVRTNFSGCHPQCVIRAGHFFTAIEVLIKVCIDQLLHYIWLIAMTAHDLGCGNEWSIFANGSHRHTE